MGPMTETTLPDQPPPEQAGLEQARLESGTYEILRGRLLSHASALKERLEKLNAARREVFGSIPFELRSTERITTKNNCVPRDMIPVGGDRFLFGFNVHIGLKTETRIDDVFAAYEFKGRGAFRELSLDSLVTPEFTRDFHELYKYYRGTTFGSFRSQSPYLYMAFRVGKAVTDIKSFRFTASADGLRYDGNRFDHEFRYPSQHEFEWKRAVRDFHRHGKHPHISIDDRVFVECVGGDLTVKVEDNTDTGEGIYSEPVENRDQTLDDAEIFYAALGNLILIKIRPFQEKNFRYLVYSEKVRQVRRIDQIETCCVLLPDDHGIIFYNGTYQQTGEYKIFENELSDMTFSGRLEAPNGEDFLYVFHNRDSGLYILLSYNRIERKVATPIVCGGFSIFDSGEMLLFRAGDEPQKHHVVQIWQTPYVGRNVVTDAKQDSYLFKLGNPAIVECMAECHEILNLLGKEDTYANLYLDVLKKTTTIVDTYFWLGDPEAFQLREPLREIGRAAGSAIEEFEKVRRLKKTAADELARLARKCGDTVLGIDYYKLESIDIFVGHLTTLRGLRGEIVTARDVRYIDATALDAMAKGVVGHVEKLSGLCATYLLGPEALAPYRNRVEGYRSAIAGVAKVADANKLDEELARGGAELEMLIEIVGTLKIEDSTETTRIVEGISAIYATLNQVRSLLRNRRKELLGVEGAAQFDAQLKLLSQAVTNYLDLADTAVKCDEYLTKLMVQIEELEGRFADFDEYLPRLTEKRDEVYAAISTRKVQLTEARNRKTGTLFASAERILAGVRHRALAMKSIEDLNAYFASDVMIEKVRAIATQLTDLEDTVKADDILGRLKTTQQDSVRQIRDRLDLYEGGENIIRLGSHRFSVNTQPLDCTMVHRDGEMFYHLTGTKFFEKVDDPAFLETRSVWSQETISENAEVYRSEYLAYRIMEELEAGRGGSLADIAALDSNACLEWIRRFIANRYDEGYVKGVHDVDAAKILGRLLAMRSAVGLLRFPPVARGAARTFWNLWDDDDRKALLAAKLRSRGAIGRFFGVPSGPDRYRDEIAVALRQFAEGRRWLGDALIDDAAEYLCEELSSGGVFAASREALAIVAAFRKALRSTRSADEFEKHFAGVAGDPEAARDVVRDWLAGFLASSPPDGLDPAFSDEAVAILLEGADKAGGDAPIRVEIDGLIGSHPRIAGARLTLQYHEFTGRVRSFAREAAPAFERFTRAKNSLLAAKREELRIEEFMPKVLTTFVRNKLIDQHYLPLIGTNMAKQIGAVGGEKRTDRMGLLLLISPPGYGKTTLMEYFANRIGIVFMKINGPALGHKVTSLDPTEAPNAGAREEIEKLNLALEMGDNVMIYVDDIQHCDPEFLQKFISLCDAQRRIEGVYRGRPRTYDLRGRKVMVVMAGNPYTESGEKFRIPDMLANRADTYNLGDIVASNADAFRLSYLENAITSNAILAPLAQRDVRDIYALVKLAESGGGEPVDFEGGYGPEQVNEMVAVMKHLLRIRDVVLRVNQEYIASAAQADAYRTEPAFKLQGSYRNMNRLAEKVVAIMTPEEVDALIFEYYRSEAQTLTTGAESNLLKLREMFGKLDGADQTRWDDIRRTYKRNLLVGQVDESDPVGRVVAQLASFNDGLAQIRESIASVTKPTEAPPPAPGQLSLSSETVSTFETLFGEIRDMIQTAMTAAPPPDGRDEGIVPGDRAKALASPTAPRIEGEYGDVFSLPEGGPFDFEPRVYTIRGRNFHTNACLYFYDNTQPVTIRSRQQVINHPYPDEPIDRFVERGEEILEFEVMSPEEARFTLLWKDIRNKGVKSAITQELRFTIVNPDRQYAPYMSFRLTVQPA